MAPENGLAARLGSMRHRSGRLFALAATSAAVIVGAAVIPAAASANTCRRCT